MKRIVIYLDSMKASGGKERVVANLLKMWSLKYYVIVVTKDDGTSFYNCPKNIEWISLESPTAVGMSCRRTQRIITSGISMIKAIKKLKIYLKTIHYDYLYTTTPLNSFEAFIAMKNPQKQLVVSEHASINAFNNLYSKMKKFVYPKAYCISVPNKMDTEEYLKWGCNAKYVKHIVTYEAVHKNKLCSKIMLNVGRLTDDKQQDKLIDMWYKVENKNGWVLWIVGDGENREILEKKIETLCITNSVKLIPATNQIDSIYKQAACFAFTSRCEGFGMVLLETMSFGIPCISYDCPSGPRDIIKDNVNGYLIENQNEKAFIEALSKIVIMEQGDLHRLGDGAFSTVKNWNNELIAQEWDDIYL